MPQKVSFQLNAADSKKLFKPLYQTINSSTVLPILECIRVVNNGSLQFSATDLESLVTIKFERSIPTNFDLCIYGDTMQKVLGNSIENIVSFSGDEYKLKIKSGEFTAKINPEHSENYPIPPKIENEKSFTIDVKEFLPLIKIALAFVSNDDLRPAMTGVYVHDVSGKLMMAATDAHRMYWKEITKTPEALKGCSMIIPAKALKIAVDMFRDGSIVISNSDSNFRINNETKEIVTRKIDARFPDYPVVIPRDLPVSFNLIRKQLVAFLKISKHFTNHSTWQTRMIVSPENIKASGEDADFSLEFEYTLPVYNANKKFVPFDFGLNINMLLELISQSGDEYVKIDHSGDSQKAIIIDECMLLMPLMLNR